MNNLDRIKAQKNDFDDNGNPTKPLNQELIDKMILIGSNKYSSGREKKVGDWQIYGFLHELKNGEDNTVSLITLHEDEYNTVYQDAPNMDKMKSQIILELINI